MRLTEILAPERVIHRLEARDKNAALREIARAFALSDPRLDEGEVLRVLQEREALASTGVGSGVAIPHGRLAALEGLTAVLAICPAGVPFDAIDGEPATIFVAVLAPLRHSADHLKALARVSRMMRDEAARGRLLAAEDRAALWRAFSEEDARH
jgi:PTS system nitrogen regulatory IIA component